VNTLKGREGFGSHFLQKVLGGGKKKRAEAFCERKKSVGGRNQRYVTVFPKGNEKGQLILYWGGENRNVFGWWTACLG